MCSHRKVIHIGGLILAVEKAHLIAKIADDKKADHVRALDVRGLTDYADCIVLCSGSSDRHVAAVADNIVSELKKLGEYPIGVEGLPQAKWVLVDYGDVVIHIFLDQVRDYYNLDHVFHKALELYLQQDYQLQNSRNS